MTLQIIDRRLAGKNKSIGNRERFLRRYKTQIRDAVRGAVSERGIRDMEQPEDIRIPKKDLREPIFHHGKGGVRDTVHPGNTDYLRGDRIQRPQGGGGARGDQASDSGEGEDDFVFTLSKEEFMQVFFEDLELPRLLRSHIGETPKHKTHRAGYTRDGTPANLHIVRSMRGALGRRLALGAPSLRALKALRAELAACEQAQREAQSALPAPAEAGVLDVATLAGLLPEEGAARSQRMHQLRTDIAALEQRLKSIPFLDPLDLRFRGRVQVPEPSSQAVMFCLMDVSGSMDEARKDLAKRFFIILYLFLTRHYEKIELVFIRHHTQAQEVDEHDFFHATESGGTVVSSALELMQKIQSQRYDPSQWNIYAAQASDGDNYGSDSPRCGDILANALLPVCRYFAYVQVVDYEQTLWDTYAQVAEKHDNFAMRKACDPTQIYPVFRDLFKKEGASV
jgi:uncharacterized sporulation protein YeaH/YhbH (DUF444 family)